MALINCPECGHQMSDTVKKCPNCGYKVKNSSKTKGFLSRINIPKFGWLIVIIGLFLVGISMPTMSNFAIRYIDPYYEEFYFGCILFLVGIFAMFYGCRILRRTFRYSMPVFYCLATISIIILIGYMSVMGFDHWKPSFKSNQVEQTNNETSILEKPALEFIGTYIYNQPDNSGRAEKLIIILNEDETAVAKATVRGEEKNYYGSWSRYTGNNIKLTFSDAYFTWNGRTTSLLDAWIDWGEAINVDGSVIRDGYLYANYDMAKAKNPEHRVKLEKTK